MRVGFLLDPGARPGPYESWAPLAMGLAFAAILAAVLIMVFGAVTWYGFEDLVEEIVYPHEVGFSKPDPRIYAPICTA
jgi:hypothetical protein